MDLLLRDMYSTAGEAGIYLQWHQIRKQNVYSVSPLSTQKILVDIGCVPGLGLEAE